MKAVVCGAGKMGVAIGYAMKKLGYSVAIVEKNHDSISKFFDVNGDCMCYGHWTQIEKLPDIFISSLPYHATLDAAVWCIEKGIRYCDLGGSVPVSSQIHDCASRDAKMPVMTDLGLAPGWVNIAAEEIYQLMPDADTVVMMVGGIPAHPIEDDPFKYKITWSVDGLINEYIDTCIVLDNGYKTQVNGMDGLESVNINGMQLEAFNTSGASAHTIDVMEKRGVKNCYYKTIRWPGHCNLIKRILKAFEPGEAINRAAIETLLTSASVLYDKDMIILNVMAKLGNRRLNKSLVVNAGDEFSAMQRATAFPIASVADILARGELDKHVSPTYDLIPMSKFNSNLNLLLGKY
jgi:saccharopine dehydrogenase-like NADP-dependent oxidoreductase